MIALSPKSIARGGEEKPSPLFDRQPVPDAQAQPPDTLDAPDASREFRTEQPRIGGLVRNATHRGETEVWGINPALATWTASGLVSPWDPALLARQRVDARGSQPIDRSLVGLGTMLFLLGILVDRSRPSKIGILDVLRRWREWVAAHRV